MVPTAYSCIDQVKALHCSLQCNTPDLETFFVFGILFPHLNALQGTDTFPCPLSLNDAFLETFSSGAQQQSFLAHMNLEESRAFSG